MFQSGEQASTCPCCYGKVARCHLPWPLPAALGISAGLPLFRGGRSPRQHHYPKLPQGSQWPPGHVHLLQAGNRPVPQPRAPLWRQGAAAPVSGAQLSNTPTQGLLREVGSSSLLEAPGHTCRSQTTLPTLPTKPPGSLRRSKAVTEATARNSQSSSVFRKVKGKTGTFSQEPPEARGAPAAQCHRDSSSLQQAAALSLGKWRRGEGLPAGPDLQADGAQCRSSQLCHCTIPGGESSARSAWFLPESSLRLTAGGALSGQPCSSGWKSHRQGFSSRSCLYQAAIRDAGGKSHTTRFQHARGAVSHRAGNRLTGDITCWRAQGSLQKAIPNTSTEKFSAQQPLFAPKDQ